LLPLVTLLGAGLAIAAPKPTKPRATATCSTPGEAKCLEKGYIDSVCGQKHRTICEPILEAALKAEHAKNNAPVLKTLRPNLTDIPGDLRPMQFRAYPGPKPGKRISVAGTGALSDTGLAQLPVARNIPVSAATAKTKHRKPAWDANGQQITACAEYGYETHYDWARFVDASSACKGDPQCVLDVAYLSTTPGIAKRQLERKDGARMASQLPVLKSGKLPKNDMFTYSGIFARAGKAGWLPKTPEIEALSAALDAGANYYSFGCVGKACSSGNKFGDEWDFHRIMRTRNKDVSFAENAEYERRKAAFRELVALHQAAVAAERRIVLDKKTAPSPKPAFDEVMSDPFDRMTTMKGYAAAMLAQRPKLLAKLPAVDKAQLQIAGVEGIGGGVQGRRHEPQSPTAMLAMPAPSPVWPTASMPPVKPPGPLVSPCIAKNFTKVSETFGVGPISCRIGEFLREEWRRKARGQKSCLDLANDDCDWSPQTFTMRYLGEMPLTESQDRVEKFCVDWTSDKFDVVRSDIAATDAYIKEMQLAIGAASMKLAPFKSTVGTHSVYAKKFAEAEHMGDKDVFAGGYSYDLGWRLEVFPDDKGKGVCQVEGRGHGKATIDGWVAGTHVPIADGGIDGIVNEGGEQKGEITTWLTVLGKEVLPKSTQSYSQVFEPKHPLELGLDLPPTHPSFTVMAGPVPITGAAWGSLNYGMNFKFEAVSRSKTCDIDDLEFGMNTTFEPWLSVNGHAQVGIGISGFASAGIRGMLNLVRIALPVHVDLVIAVKNIAQQAQPTFMFDVSMDLTLATLSGSISLYIELMGFEEELEIFRWNGIGPATIPLIHPALHAEMPLTGF
jgi:hypothetical protein